MSAAEHLGQSGRWIEQRGPLGWPWWFRFIDYEDDVDDEVEDLVANGPAERLNQLRAAMSETKRFVAVEFRCGIRLGKSTCNKPMARIWHTDHGPLFVSQPLVKNADGEKSYYRPDEEPIVGMMQLNGGCPQHMGGAMPSDIGPLLQVYDRAVAEYSHARRMRKKFEPLFVSLTRCASD